MSLKAKIEAVIYASEEPVTLAQLAGLLGQEAQAELDRRASAQQSLLLDGLHGEAVESAGAPDLLNGGVVSDEVSAQPLEALREGSGEAAALLTPSVDDKLDDRKAAREERARGQRLRDHFRALLDELIADYADPGRGLEIREVAGGYRLATKPEYHDAVRGFVRSLKPPLKLTLQALETLAVVAYKQPVTAPEIAEIRGVDSGGVLGSLMARKLITTAGRKQVIGRPILYKTTRDFLLRFGLKDVSELPSIEEFEKMAGELAEAEPTQEEIPMVEHQNSELDHGERDVTMPQADGDTTSVEKAAADGRLSGPPPVYDQPMAEGESPAHDAEVQAGAEGEADPENRAETNPHFAHYALGRNQ